MERPLPNKLPQVKAKFFPLSGGLDMVTPAITMPAGRTFDCINYEPEISGGYRRVDGYERYDGRSSPTDDAVYSAVSVVKLNTVQLNVTLTGETSGASGTCVGVFDKEDYSVIVISGVDPATDNFVADEFLRMNDGTRVARAIADSGSASDPSDDADYQLLAANDVRGAIQPLPGTGPIRGIFTLNDKVHAFRDTGTGTMNLYRADPGGWIQILLGKEIQFANGTAEIKPGDVITNQSGTVTAVAAVVLTRAGTWGVASPQAKGTIVLSFNSLQGGNFAAGQQLYVAGVARCVASTAVTDITLNGGATQKMELIKHAFGNAVGNQVIYGCDGNNLAFEYNGTNFIPIRTRDTGVDFPNHVAAHMNFLFLAFGTNLQWSVVNEPYTWDGALGAGEAVAGDAITGMLPLVGGNQDPAMSVFTKTTVSMFYGSSSSSFRLQNTVIDIGYSSNTIQPISGSAFGLTARGLQTLKNTQAFGDFNFSSISELVHPLVSRLRGYEQCSVVLKDKNQYRVYYGDQFGTVVSVGLTGENVTGIMPLQYGKIVRCIWSDTFSNGLERTFFGSDDGYIYEDNKGTSFDGAEIESWVRLPFNHVGSPTLKKRWRRAVIEAKVDKFCKVNFSYDLGYGNPDVLPAPAYPDASLVGGSGGYWDQFYWEQFHWDAQVVASPSVTIEGSEKNISLLFYSNRAQDSSHTLQGITLLYSERRNER